MKKGVIVSIFLVILILIVVAGISIWKVIDNKKWNAVERDLDRIHIEKIKWLKCSQDFCLDFEGDLFLTCHQFGCSDTFDDPSNDLESNLKYLNLEKLRDKFPKKSKLSYWGTSPKEVKEALDFYFEIYDVDSINYDTNNINQTIMNVLLQSN